MGQFCEVCGKTPVVGNQVKTRGRAKYLGGVGTKITGITRRKFKPNLRTVRVSTPIGTHKTMRVCARCLRAGAIRKTVRNHPFKLQGAVAAEREPEVPKAGQVPTEAPALYAPPEGVKVRKRRRKKDQE
jgi:large subunit ribosomal protein L28